MKPGKTKRFNVYPVIVLVLAFIAAMTWFRDFEHSSIFYPASEISATPADVGLPFEDILIMTEDKVTINAWLVKASTESPTVIFCHGNAGNISDRLAKLQLFHRMGLNVLLLDYRGYGKSRGVPSEAGLYKDAAAAYDYLQTRRDIDPSRLVGYGESLGGGVIIDLATKKNLAALIIDSAFTSIADMSKKVYPFIPSSIIMTKFDSINKVQKISAPKLFLHSRVDEIVPFEQGQRLYEAAAEPKEFLEIYGGHNDFPSETEETMAKEIVEFLRRHDITP